MSSEVRPNPALAVQGEHVPAAVVRGAAGCSSQSEGTTGWGSKQASTSAHPLASLRGHACGRKKQGQTTCHTNALESKPCYGAGAASCRRQELPFAFELLQEMVWTPCRIGRAKGCAALLSPIQLFQVHCITCVDSARDGLRTICVIFFKRSSMNCCIGSVEGIQSAT